MHDSVRYWSTLLVGAILFALAHTQGPLFYSNQNQYLLHGLAAGGWGDLDHDWLSTTSDPTPVFSALIAVTARYLNLDWLYVDYFILLAVYFVSLVTLCDALPFTPRSGVARFAFLTLLIAVHAAAVRLWSVWLTGVDYPWYLQCGVANQYLLGPGLQPSAFGILLVTSLAAFAHRRLVLAAACIAIAATFHATYLLPGAMLVLAYMHVLWWGGQRRAAMLLGAGTLLAVLPVTVYSVRMFAPTSAEQFATAQRLLVETRIPHHAQMSRWLDRIAAAQVAWALLAVALVRGTRLFMVFVIPSALGLALSAVQAMTDSAGLALLFPWRISTVLVPIATAIILSRLCSWTAAAHRPPLSPRGESGGGEGAAPAPSPPAPLPRRGEGGRWQTAGAQRLVGGAAVAAILFSATYQSRAVRSGAYGYAMNEDELPLMDYVRTHKQPGDVYLIPVTVPKTRGIPRGTASTTFLPPPRPTPGTAYIPVDLQRFRVLTGAPVYVDYKSIPYKDADVLEWSRRLQHVQAWYTANDWGRLRDDLIREGITHVVMTADRGAGTAVFEQVYADDVYRLYRVRRD
jgi:hypothetical protein